MTIKRVKVLAADPKGADKISSHNFRSLEELQEYLKGMYEHVKGLYALLPKYERLFAATASASMVLSAGPKKIEIERQGSGEVSPDAMTEKPRSSGGKKITLEEEVKMPNLETLQKNFDVVQELQNDLDILDTLEAQIQHQFRDHSGRTGVVRAMKTMRASIESKVDKAFKFLNTVAKKHEPTELKDIIKSIVEEIKVNAKSRYTSLKQNIYLSSGVDKQQHHTLVFTHYVELANFRDDDGNVYPEYYIVFTAEIDRFAKMAMYVNTLTKFRTPGNFKVGHQFSNPQEGLHMLETILETENFVGLIEKSPLPVGSKDVKKNKFAAKNFIEKIEVGDHEIFVKFTKKVTGANFQKVNEQVFLDLKGLLTQHAAGTLKYRVGKEGTQIVVTYIFTLPDTKEMKESRIDQGKLNLVQRQLGLSDDETKAIVRLLNKGY